MQKNSLKAALIVSSFVAGLSGCGQDHAESTAGANGRSRSVKTATANPDSETESAKRVWDPSLGTATIGGVVRFEGQPPRRREIDMASRAECAKLHAEPVRDETVIVGPGGALKNVVVRVSRGIDDWTFSVPKNPVMLDQKGCTFHPHVIAVQTGQGVLIRNSDSFAHNVHALPTVNQPFNFTQGRAGTEETRTFSRPEMMVRVRRAADECVPNQPERVSVRFPTKPWANARRLIWVGKFSSADRLKCDIHGWMNAYVNVLPHPFFDVTAADRTFQLPKQTSAQFASDRLLIACQAVRASRVAVTS